MLTSMNSRKFPLLLNGNTVNLHGISCWSFFTIRYTLHLVSVKGRHPKILFFLWSNMTAWWWQRKSAETFSSKYDFMIFTMLGFSGPVIDIDICMRDCVYVYTHTHTHTHSIWNKTASNANCSSDIPLNFNGYLSSRLLNRLLITPVH